MTKLEVATLLREKTGLSQRQAMQVVQVVLETIKGALKHGSKVALVGFGTFYVKEKRPRKGHNPRTREKITVPAKSVVVFKPGREFRQLVDNPDTPAVPSRSALRE